MFHRWQWHGLINLIFQGQCPLCQRSTSQPFCQNCLRQVRGCQLGHRQQFPLQEIPVFAWGEYKGALKRTIAAFKYDGKPHLARPLGHWLAEAWLATPTPQPQNLTVVPIPMHPDKQRQRGFNQAELLAVHFCELTRLPLMRHGLERNRETIAQFHLSLTERERNLAGAFTLGQALRRPKNPSPVLLLDDIYTTGATVRSAVATLIQQGIPVQGVVVVAQTLKERSKSAETLYL
jgi:ComF family protein